MIIKKFQAENETDAILLAKEELGKDAIVMNIKTLRPRGIYKLFKKAKVEVTAAIDENVTYDNEKMLEKIQEIADTQKSVNMNKMELYKHNSNIIMDEETANAKSSPASAIEEKLNSLQDLLEKQMRTKAQDEKFSDEKKELEQTNSCIELIYKQLISNEVDEKYADQIMEEIKKTINRESSVDNILASIYQKIVLKLGQVNEIEMTEGKTRFIFFIGPTGVGKTTTIAKIASYYKLNKKAKIALITSDTYRIAAVEQLRTYANILGLPLQVVYTEEEIAEAVDTFANYDLVLVDTAGRSHKNKEQRDDIEKLINVIPEESREIYLVLSATTKYKDLIKIAEIYKMMIKYNLIFTKLDETSSIGAVLNIRMLTGASLSYATWGQNVPDDIGQIDAQKIAKQLLGGIE